MKIAKKSIEIGGRTLSLETGKLAQQATSAVVARYGDTMVISTVVMSSKESQLDYFPLSVEYIERLYAGGKIKGSRWVKREGKPSDDAILKGRLIDRSIRPLFNPNFRKEIQIIITVLSVDGENEPDVLGAIATSAALAISPIPWDGPIGSVRVGYVLPENGKRGFFANPTTKEIEFSEIDLVVSATEEKVLMIEAGANEVGENAFIPAIKFAKDEINKIIKVINDLKDEVGIKKINIPETNPNKELLELLKKKYRKEIISGMMARINKEEKEDSLNLLTESIIEKNPNKFDKKEIKEVMDYLFKKQVRDDILKNNKRLDGRKLNQVRPIEVELGLLPRTHGSAMFKRGDTQVLTVATLGAPSLEQLIESPEGETSKSYMHHYSMPPYSVGETGRVGFPKRREIGHGALAEKALLPVIPSQNSFPYAIRLVSEVMSSNGSTSMASTCGSTLSLMDAGVPIINPITGISVGLVEEGKKYVLLLDILGIEDHCGDMDFKVAGSKKGVTAIQLDVKNKGLTDDMISKALSQAKEGRQFILEKILLAMPAPRSSLSQYAPRVKIISLPQDKIGEVIGPGGKVIRQIIAQTGCSINVDDDGQVTICGTDPVGVERAESWINNIIKEVLPGEMYEGTVKRILSFGAFIEILPGKEGMVHVSQMSTGFVKDAESVVSIGQKVQVRIVKIDDMGRINLSMLSEEDAKKQPERGSRNYIGGKGSFDKKRKPFRSRY